MTAGMTGRARAGVMASPRRLKHAFRLLFLRITTQDVKRRRLQGIIQGVATGLGNKGVSIATGFLSVPLTIHYLGPERYGIWLTITSLFAWLTLTDFGVGLGLNTALGRAVSEDDPDLVREYIATAMAMLLGVALLVGMALAAAWPWIDWSHLLGARTAAVRAEVGPALALALTLWSLQFPLSVIGRVYNAHAEGRLANYWAMAGNLTSLLALLIVTETEGGLIWLIASLMGAGLTVNMISGLWLFGIHRPAIRPRLHDLSMAALRTLMSGGGTFFLIQILSLVVFQSDNIVVGHFLGSSQVPIYTLTYNLFNYCGLLQVLLFPYLWIAYTEAITRGDIAWVRRTYKVCVVGGTALTVMLAIGLSFVAQPFIGWWAGPQVIPPLSLVLWMVAWAVVNAYTSPLACLLAAASHLRSQTLYSALAAVTNVGLTITLVQVWGVTGVIAATVMSYLVFICGPILIDVERLLSRLESRGQPVRRPTMRGLAALKSTVNQKRANSQSDEQATSR